MRMKKSIHAVKYIFAVWAVVVAAALPWAVTSAAHAEEAKPAAVAVVRADGENAAPTVTIAAAGEEFVYRDEYIEPTDFTVVEQIRTRRINAPLKEKFELVDKYLAKGADYKTALSVCFPRLAATVGAASERVYKPATDAEVTYRAERFTVSREKCGIAVDESRLYASIYYTLKFAGGGEVVAPTTVLQPSVTASMIRAELNVRGRYTTEYASSTASRAHNVELALRKLDGACIKPGESLSFNRTVGERTAENGFESAKIIVDGKYTDGVGGGVCQASTALYNAALLAGLPAAANAHSICPSYCPPGLDAMISGYSDLVVKNTTGGTVRIAVHFENRSATVTVYGVKSTVRIVPESVVVKRIEHESIEQTDTEHKYFDATASCGDRQLVAVGKDGYMSETYLNYYENGVLTRRDKIRADTYKPTPQVIAVAP